MQTLGISESTPRTESRLKSLFWPSIETGADVDYLAVQGYWVCTIVALISLPILIATGQLVSGIIAFLLYYLAGIGVREHSRFAATIVFIVYALDTIGSLRVLIASPAGVVLRIVITALLLSNLRATWIAGNWRVGSEEATLPPRLSETWRDRFADQWPAWLWPKVRLLYYILSILYVLLAAAGIVMIVLGRAHA